MRYTMILPEKPVSVNDYDKITTDVLNNTNKYKITGICACGKQFKKQPTMDNRDTWFLCPYCSAKYTNVKYNRIERRKQARIQQYGSLKAYQDMINQKIKATRIEKYGDLAESYRLAQEQAKKTNLDKYGCEYTFQAEQVKDKIKTTISMRYNNGIPIENISQVREVRHRIKQTNLERYGSEEYLASQDAKIKTKKRSMEKYNTENPNMADVVKQHKVNSVLTKYGVTNVNKLPEVREKIYQTCLSRYGKYWNVYKYCYDNQCFDSSWKLIYYIWLKHNNIQFTYHPKIAFAYELENGSVGKYEPDFEIDGTFYEIKGDHFFNDKGELLNPYKKGKPLCLNKQKCMMANNVVVLKSKELADAFAYADAIQFDMKKYKKENHEHNSAK